MEKSKVRSPLRVLRSGKVRVSPAKLRRDALLLRHHAAVVLVLDREGNITERIVRDPNDILVVRLIVVLAPVEHQGERIEESCVFEVGFSHTRPYARTNLFEEGKRIFDISPRKRVATLSVNGYQHLYPEILLRVRALLFDIREGWSMKDAWKAGPRGISFERGIRFTIHRSDLPCCAHVLMEDIRFRREQYFAHHAAKYKEWMKKYLVSHDKLSDKQLLATKGVSRVIERLCEMRYPMHYLREIHNRFGMYEQDLFERIFRAAKLPFVRESSLMRLVDWALRQGFVPVEGVRFRLVRNHTHGETSKMITVEAFFEKEYRESYEIPF